MCRMWLFDVGALMDKALITRRLAEKMQLHKTRNGYAIRVNNASWWPLSITQPFNPWVDMNHAFAVMEWMKNNTNKALWVGYEDDDGWFVSIGKAHPHVVLPETDYTHYPDSEAPEAITLAIARDLFTAEELEECGL